MESLGRRGFLTGMAGAGLAFGATAGAEEADAKGKKGKRAKRPRFQNNLSPFPLVLNTSTIRPATLLEKIDAAAEAGYDGIEPWIDDIEKHEKDGNDLKDLGKLIADKGLFVINVIGLWNAIPQTQEAWDAHLPETRNRLRMMSAIGSKHAAVITDFDLESIDMKYSSARYKELLNTGRSEFNLLPAVEFVGFSKNMSRIGQAASLCLDADDKDACMIADTFHMYRSGCGFNGVQLLNGDIIGDFHWNDVPKSVPAETAGDEHRVFPGDGDLPLVPLLKDLVKIRYTGPLSLELFNREHWAMNPKEVAKIGKDKMLAGIAEAGI